MPIYEYKCNSCGKDFEKLIFSSSASKNIECEYCGSEDVEKKISNVSSFGNSDSFSSSFGGCGSGGFSWG